MNDGYILSNRTDSYRHLAIVALFLNHFASIPLYLAPLQNFSFPTSLVLSNGSLHIPQFSA